MRDPRLVELELLMDLERATAGLTVRCTNEDKTSGSQVAHSYHLYGVDRAHFRDLVIALAQQDFISTTTPYWAKYDGEGVKSERRELIRHIASGELTSIAITHAGRLRLWDLRDALLREPELDPSGLRSRRAWDRDLIVRLRWASLNEPLAIIMVELDEFGPVAHELGVAIADDVLNASFELIRSYMGARGHAYRITADEVGALLPNTNLDLATRLAEDLRAAIESEVGDRVKTLGRRQTASVGVTTFNSYIDPRAAVVRVADLMREAKRGGRNRVASAPTMIPA
jgi:diguanylate cyclase (GGDEF)-like protein